MNDTVERLRQFHDRWDVGNTDATLASEAADEIERLRAALKQIADEPMSASASEAVMIARIAIDE